MMEETVVDRFRFGGMCGCAVSRVEDAVRGVDSYRWTRLVTQSVWNCARCEEIITSRARK